MSVYEVLKSLALLPAVLILALTAGAVLTLRWRRLGLGVIWATIVAFYLLSAPYTANRFAQMVQTVPPLTDLSKTRDAQAIVVLSAGANAGGAEYGGIMLDQLTTVRLRYAAHLYRLTGLPLLVTGGHILGTQTSLAAAMKQALEQDFGVPVAWTEDRSPDTGANARLSAAILRKAGVRKIVLVTHASHMPRSLALFRATGLEVVPAPTGFANVSHDLPRDLIPRMSALETSYLATYEAMGGLWYRIRPTPSEVDDAKPVLPAGNP